MLHRKILVIIFCFIALTFFCNGNTVRINSYLPIDTVREALNAIPIDNYVGKPIDSLIAHLPATFQSRRFTLNLPKSHRVKHVRSLVYSYKNGDKVEIFVKRYQFMNPIDPNEVWDFNLFRKEIAFVIQITSKDGFQKWAKLQE